MELQTPFSPQQQAARAWGLSSVNAYRTVPYEKRADDISYKIAEARKSAESGGTHYYNPAVNNAFVQNEAPCESVGEGTVNVAYSKASVYGPAPPPIQKPVYSLGTTPMSVEPVALDVRRTPCKCYNPACNTFSGLKARSIGLVLFSVENALRIRKLLEQSNLVVVSDALAAQKPECICGVMGDVDDFWQGLFEMASDYMVDPIAKDPHPAQTILKLNDMYAKRIAGRMRESVNDKLRLQYAGYMRNAASLDPRPCCPEGPVREDPGYYCPDYLEQQLATPNITPAMRLEYARLTGLPVSTKTL